MCMLEPCCATHSMQTRPAISVRHSRLQRSSSSDGKQGGALLYRLRSLPGLWSRGHWPWLLCNALCLHSRRKPCIREKQAPVHQVRILELHARAQHAPRGCQQHHRLRRLPRVQAHERPYRSLRSAFSRSSRRRMARMRAFSRTYSARAAASACSSTWPGGTASGLSWQSGSRRQPWGRAHTCICVQAALFSAASQCGLAWQLGVPTAHLRTACAGRACAPAGLLTRAEALWGRATSVPAGVLPLPACSPPARSGDANSVPGVGGRCCAGAGAHPCPALAAPWPGAQPAGPRHPGC